MEELKNDLLELYRLQKLHLKKLHSILYENRWIDENPFAHTIKTRLTPEKIIHLVEDVFQANVKDKSRKKNTIFVRKAAAYTLRKYTNLSLNEICPHIGVSDHATVLYNINTAQDYIDTMDDYREKIYLIDEEIRNYNKFVEQEN